MKSQLTPAVTSLEDISTITSPRIFCADLLASNGVHF